MIYKKIPTLLGNYYDYFEGIYQSISADSVPPVTAQDGINVMKIIEAAFESNTLKKAIVL